MQNSRDLTIGISRRFFIHRIGIFTWDWKPTLKCFFNFYRYLLGPKSSGDITVYAPKPHGGNCGFPKFSPMTEQFFVAIPKPVWDKGIHCGRCIQATCTAG